jgi:predicted NBD/HSP70 family sugar kinase
MAYDLNLDRSTITKVVSQFIDCGIIHSTGKFRDKPGVGRLATALEINPNFGLVLGIEVQTDYFKTVLVNLDGQILDFQITAYLKENGTIEEQLVRLINGAAETGSHKRIPLIGVGLGVSGIVDPYSGTIIYSFPLQIIHPLKLKEHLYKKTGFPVYIENDANCCCWGEMAFSQSPKHRNFLAILGEFRSIDITSKRKNGIAVGIGIVARGNVLHGDNFTAGEFKSLKYDYNKPSHVQFSISDDEAATLPDNRPVLETVLRELAYNISLLVNSLDTTQIIVAGDLSRYLDDFEPILREEIQKNWLYSNQKEINIKVPSDELNGVSFGAAGLFVSKLFSTPEMSDHIEETVGSILLEGILSNRAGPT